LLIARQGRIVSIVIGAVKRGNKYKGITANSGIRTVSNTFRLGLSRLNLRGSLRGCVCNV